MPRKTEHQFEALVRTALGCRECFRLKEVSAPFIDVAQPRWVGPRYWTAAVRAVILLCNPGQSGEDAKSKAMARGFLSQIKEFRSGTLPLRSILKGQRDVMPGWGNPAGRFGRFYIQGLGLKIDEIATANVAWCATAENIYPRKMLNRCFEWHTDRLLRLLQPDVIVASGQQAQAFGDQIRVLLPSTKIINTFHYAHRKGQAAEARELRRVRRLLDGATRRQH